MSGFQTPDLGAITWSVLTLADLETMYALHVCSIAGMSVQAVKPESKEFLHSILAGRGVVMGAWHGTTLVAYGVLQHDLKPEDLWLAGKLLLPGSPPSFYKLAGAAVHPAWRGIGLQRAVIRQRMQIAPVSSVLFATASPVNLASWHNLLVCGFAVRDVQYLYGGYARYVLVYARGDAWNAATTEGLTLAPEQLQQQHALLQQGWRGVARGDDAGSLRLAPAQRGVA